MANCSCGNKPTKFVNCCDVMNCINLQSSDNTIDIERSDCGVDLTINPNTLDNLLTINNGTCITMVKQFIDGKLVITPVIDWTCVASNICSICNPPTCPTPIFLRIVADADLGGSTNFPYDFPIVF
jgi:hypothetical protein